MKFPKTALLAGMATLILSAESCKKNSPPPEPIAGFNYSGAGLAPATVTFTNASSNATSYQWDFGDNSTSFETSPTHKYNAGGVYTVTLRATGAGGTATTSKTVNITSPTSVKITNVKLLGMPFTDGSGAGWDPVDGPDVYFTLSDAADNILLTGSTFNNVSAIPPTLTWVISPNYQISNFSSIYKVRIMDYDSADPDDFIGGYQFPFSSYAATGYPTTIILQTTGNPLKIELDVQWQ